ncbi:transposase family protein [Nocardia amamiensis]|uniref:transposase family protein n=1 Tax=Nocardia amamiensis TaxID=404578 RepID=UPI000832B22A|nr:transposase family protein [Nocardia amamiensis]
MTGLTGEQLTELTARVHQQTGALISRGRPFALGLFKSVVLVVMLLRRNITQEFAAGIFGVSQPTVSRRWDLLRPVIGVALAEFVPDPARVIGAGTALVDGTICPTWNWHAHPGLFSGKAGMPGINVQIAADLEGKLVAVGTVPVPGARHDAFAFAASGLASTLTDLHTIADLGYLGVDGIDQTPIRKPRGRTLRSIDAAFNTQIASIRAAVERAVACLKTWRMLSEEGGRFRAPIEKFASMLEAVVGLHFFSTL